MSGSGDHPDEMFRRLDLDDDTIDAILDGRDPGRPELAMLVGFADDARSLNRRPAPPPSASLAAILTEGISTEKGDLLATAGSNVPGPDHQAAGLPKWRRKKMALAEFLTGLSVGAKAALGIGIAAAAVTGAGAAGALPGPAQHAVASTVSAVTPFEFPDNASPHADFGKSTSSDATGTSDGQPGVDGQSIASNAPENGLSVARQTPAGDHVPASVPADSSSTRSSDDSSNESTQSSEGSTESSIGIDTASGTPGGSHIPPAPSHP